ncbi:hypothetical protein L6452_13834 [Arctium lappa]|uniref:Uncharacterized protein n=1 Tax=Arctium lappa TaxID=4217 RepID=A0ACB9CJE6_ARCLA|nr:hypothetical protein L6452_13834 [Arctium lappa]
MKYVLLEETTPHVFCARWSNVVLINKNRVHCPVPLKFLLYIKIIRVDSVFIDPCSTTGIDSYIKYGFLACLPMTAS